MKRKISRISHISVGDLYTNHGETLNLTLMREDVDMNTFEQLGVIKNTATKPMEAINKLFDALHKVFERKEVTKKAIVEVMGDFIPNFKHIETGKSLDQKM